MPDVAAALQGARDIIAERVNDDADARAQVRELFLTRGMIRSEVIAGKETEGAKFKDYFDWSEPLASAPSHRVLAIRRGAAEGLLFFQIRPPEEDARRASSNGSSSTASGPAAEQVRLAVQDCYKRLLSLSMETEARLESKKRADAAAIDVFAENLRQLLLAAAARPEARAGDRPRLPHRLQDRRARRPGQAAAQRRDLPRPGPAADPRGGGDRQAPRRRSTRSRRSRSATAPAGARPKPSSASSACRRRSRS